MAAVALSGGEPVRPSPARAGVLADDRAAARVRTVRRAAAATVDRPRDAGLEDTRLGRRRRGTHGRSLGRPLPGDPSGAGPVNGGEADSASEGDAAVASHRAGDAGGGVRRALLPWLRDRAHYGAERPTLGRGASFPGTVHARPPGLLGLVSSHRCGLRWPGPDRALSDTARSGFQHAGPLAHRRSGVLTRMKR